MKPQQKAARAEKQRDAAMKKARAEEFKKRSRALDESRKIEIEKLQSLPRSERIKARQEIRKKYKQYYEKLENEFKDVQSEVAEEASYSSSATAPADSTPAMQSKTDFVSQRMAAVLNNKENVATSVKDALRKKFEQEYDERAFLKETINKATSNGYGTLVGGFIKMLKEFLEIQQGIALNYGNIVWTDEKGNINGMTPEEVNKLASAIRYPESLNMPSLRNQYWRKEYINCYFDVIKSVVLARSAVIIASRMAKWTNKDKSPTLIDLANSNMWYDTIAEQMRYIPVQRLLAFMFRMAANVPPKEGAITKASYKAVTEKFKTFASSSNTACEEFFQNKSSILKKGDDTNYDLLWKVSKWVGELVDNPLQKLSSTFKNIMQTGVDFIVGEPEKAIRDSLENYVRDLYLLECNDTVVTSGGIWNVDDRILQGLDMIKGSYYKGSDFNRESSIKLQNKVRQDVTDARTGMANMYAEYMKGYISFVNKKDYVDQQLVNMLGRLADSNLIKEKIPDIKNDATAKQWADTVAASIPNVMNMIDKVESKLSTLTPDQKKSYETYKENIKNTISTLKDNFMGSEEVQRFLVGSKDLISKYLGG